jgi:hypothetical protein
MHWTCHGNFCGASSDPQHPLYDYTVAAGAAGRAKLLPA